MRLTLLDNAVSAKIRVSEIDREGGSEGGIPQEVIYI
jgi:hypothetical protein